MKGIHIYRLLMIGLFCTCISTSLLATITQEDVCISIPFSQTVLLDQEELYRKGISNEPAFKRRTYMYTLVDSSRTIKDTLCGKCWYLLYFDTTILAERIELQRTKDSLCLMYNLNRDIDSYRSGEILRAPREIIVADSLIKSALHSKRIWMDRFTLYYAPYHSLIVNFTIIPLNNIQNKNYSFADNNDAIYDPIQTPVYFGKTLFCSTIVDNIDETPCDPESRLVVYSPNVKDSIQGVMQFWIHFDTTNVVTNKELKVKEIVDLEFIGYDKTEFGIDALRPAFYEELRLWHWWLGDYINPLTMYPWQQWTMRFIVVPQ